VVIARLDDLLPLVGKNDDLIRESLIKHPEWLKQLDEVRRVLDAGKKVSVEGFKIFYRAIYDRELPKVDEQVIEEFVYAFHNKTGVMFESWRGHGKSTILTAWCPYVMGVRPVGSTSLIRINDGKAKEAGKAIATIIETNPGWKRIFPHILPDTRAGWSIENGFNVMDARVVRGQEGTPEREESYAKWRQMCLADHGSEQSLLCAGIESGSIIGTHPSNGSWYDDLHDESNTRSQAELKKVTDIVEKNIVPTWFSVAGSPTIGVFCTPWSENPPDAYQIMLKTRMFKHVKLPLFNRDEDGELFEPMGVRVKLTWPEAFPMEKVEKMWEANPAHFGQMCLCDLETLKGLRLKREWLHEFPAEKLNETWPVYFGIDFATTSDKLGKKDTDYFCCAIGRVIPGGMVLVGGFRGRLTISEALTKMKALASFYPTLQTIGVEKYGAGKDFAELLEPLVYSTNLPVVTFPFAKAPQKSKGQKFENELAPMFTSGRMWISDVKDDFIRAFEDEWISWDGTRSLTRHDDTLDAVYGMAYVGQGHIMPQVQEESLPVRARERQRSPLAGIGATRGY
jgi:hypothetical protein